jgi:hypothetical protein
MGDSSEAKIVTETAVFRQNREKEQQVLCVPAATEFKRKSVRGGAATMLGQGVGMAPQIGTTVVLARLLSPGDYGTVIPGAEICRVQLMTSRFFFGSPTTVLCRSLGV